MKKLSFIILLVFLGSQVQAQSNSDLIGIQTKDNFKQQPYGEWFTLGYKSYIPDAKTVKEIKKHLKGITIIAFMGTWCGDSKRETPHFYKIMDEAGFNYKNLTMVTVNRDKETPDHLEEGKNITHVPTFIFYKKGKEIGRFVEYPRETLEKDILKIVSGKPYKNSYED